MAVFADFQEETLKDQDAGFYYGLEKFWAFLTYYKVKYYCSSWTVCDILGSFPASFSRQIRDKTYVKICVMWNNKFGVVLCRVRQTLQWTQS